MDVHWRRFFPLSFSFSNNYSFYWSITTTITTARTTTLRQLYAAWFIWFKPLNKLVWFMFLGFFCGGLQPLKKSVQISFTTEQIKSNDCDKQSNYWYDWLRWDQSSCNSAYYFHLLEQAPTCKINSSTHAVEFRIPILTLDKLLNENVSQQLLLHEFPKQTGCCHCSTSISLNGNTHSHKRICV